MKEAQAFFLAALEFSGSDCLLWPYAKNPFGYGVVRVDGRARMAHRAILEKTSGPAPSPELQAAHDCGVKGCVNPKHLYWATRLENVADTVRHGTRLRGEAVFGSKLKAFQIPLIRADERDPKDICKDYGVTVFCITSVKSRRTWNHIP